jgi:hypothetical protein
MSAAFNQAADIVSGLREIKKGPKSFPGRLAQLGERLVYTEKVGGSIPSSPTTDPSTFFQGGAKFFIRLTLGRRRE